MAVHVTLNERLRPPRSPSEFQELGNGNHAIAQARRLRPGVILMDVMMPHMDRIEAIHASRAGAAS